MEAEKGYSETLGGGWTMSGSPKQITVRFGYAVLPMDAKEVKRYLQRIDLDLILYGTREAAEQELREHPDAFSEGWKVRKFEVTVSVLED